MRIVYGYLFPAAKYGKGATKTARSTVKAMGQPVRKVSVHPFTGDVYVRCIATAYLDSRTRQEAETHAGYRVLTCTLVER